MDYKTENITTRAEQSPLWPLLSKQAGETMPYLLERYLLLENWKRQDMWDDPQVGFCPTDEIAFLHLLLADAVTVLLSQEERIRHLETKAGTLIAGEIDRPQRASAATHASERMCEGCGKPSTHFDSEGVPLCQECYDALPPLEEDEA
ncbi:hypothetical protein OPIT5_03935 [Opitutaceae bacterium TAV5]|nr:hypothetical protein OPIT5_03935 [Opitutaceae bacterium TAV5]